MELTQAVTVGVAVLVRSRLNTKGERIVRLSVLSLPACQLPPGCRPEEKRQVIHYSFTGVRSLRQQPAGANMQEKVGPSLIHRQNHSSIVVFLSSYVQQLSLGPARAGLSDMVLQHSSNWWLCCPGEQPSE